MCVCYIYIYIYIYIILFNRHPRFSAPTRQRMLSLWLTKTRMTESFAL